MSNILPNTLKNRSIVDCSKCEEYHKYADCESKVSEPVDDECLLACICSRFLLIPEPDEEV